MQWKILLESAYVQINFYYNYIFSICTIVFVRVEEEEEEGKRSTLSFEMLHKCSIISATTSNEQTLVLGEEKHILRISIQHSLLRGSNFGIRCLESFS